MSDDLIRGPARVFIDGEELNGGFESMHWDGDKLIAEVPVELFGEVAREHVSVVVPRRDIAPAPIEFTTTIELPKVRWWTKVWCWSWHGHWPKRQDVFDFAMDYYRCPCGKVVMPAEELVELSERYGRRLP